MSDIGPSCTQLCGVIIKNMSYAQRVIGQKNENNAIPLVLMPRRSFFSFKLSIPEGFYAMVYKSGRYVGMYDPGLYVRPSWYKVNYLVSKQLTVFDTPVKNCPTKDNQIVSIDVVLIFAIEEPRDFVLKLGPEKLQEILKGAQEDAVRGLARDTLLVDALDLSGANTEEMTSSINEKVSPFGVKIKRAIITKVTIPEDTSKIWAANSCYATKQLAEIASNEFQNTVKQNESELKKTEMEMENIIKRTNDNNHMILDKLREELASIEFDREQKLHEINTQSHEELAELKARIEADEAHINNKLNEDIWLIQSQLDKDLAELRAKTSAYQRQLQSNANLKIAKFKAETLELQADAEKQISEMFNAKRAFEIEKKKLELMDKMVANNQLVIQGDNGYISKAATTPGSAPGMMPMMMERMMLESISKMGSNRPRDTTGTGTIREHVVHDSMHSISGNRKS